MNQALLLINIQNDCFPGGAMVLPGATEAVIAARKLLLAFRQEGLPVFHIQHIATDREATSFLADTPGAQFHASVFPNQGEGVFKKHFPSAFQRTTLFDVLRKEKIDSLVMAGMMAHRSISATARAAASLGFSCMVAHDACASCALTFNAIEVSALQVHAAAMAALEDPLIKMPSADELVTRIHDFKLKGS